MNKNDVTSAGLSAFGITKSEATAYLELLRKPATHAQLSAATGINRTTLYRLVSKLQKRGLVTPYIDDRGKFLKAADPSVLEVEVVNQETRAKHQRAAFAQLLPALQSMQQGFEADFDVKTYEGVDGFKRMLWHELKAQGDCLCIGFLPLQDLVHSARWAEKHRQLTVEAGYRIREIVNSSTVAENFTNNQAFLQSYEMRTIPKEVLPIHYLMATYNDTVHTYHISRGRRIGLEVTSKLYAETMRSIFELCWLAGIDADRPTQKS